MNPKPKKSPVTTALKKKGMVTVGRLKEVRDSLIQKGQYKMQAGDGVIKDARKNEKTGGKDWLGRTAKEGIAAANRLWEDGTYDLDRADRYDKIIKTAASVAKKRK